MQELLDRLYAIGEEMRIHLSNDNMDTFYELLRNRHLLVQEINGMSENSASSPELTEKFTRLDEQFKSLIKDLRVKEQALFENLKQLQNLKQAKQSYQFDRKPRQFLRSNLSG